MSSTGSEYRLDGIYKQRQKGFYMQRIKLAAGVISSVQARSVATVAAHYGEGTLHLTTRGSIEIHWLQEEDLSSVKRELAKVGLTSRGACGGAVRGVTCASQSTPEFPVLEALARCIHRHFTGNLRFEQLPKKFKIGIEADVVGGRHLIQDAGLVLARQDGRRAWYDIWIAGGLGKEPRPGFLLASEIVDERIIPIIEAIVRVYASHAPPPKRLKFLAQELGEDKLRSMIEAEPSYNEVLPVVTSLSEYIVPPATTAASRLRVPIFAGTLTTGQFGKLADFSEAHADGVMVVTTNQDIDFHLPATADPAAAAVELQAFTGLAPAGVGSLTLRVCPGSHECLMGLSATRDVARELLAHLGERGKTLSWALSGCTNSCSQPQLADVGIVCSSLVTSTENERTPRFDLYRSGEGVFGTLAERSLSLDQLCSRVQEIG